MPDLTPAEARARAALRTARERAGMSQLDLALALGWGKGQQSRVSRIENGTLRIKAHEVEPWLRATGATSEETAGVVRLFEDAAVHALTWGRVYATAGGVAARQLDYEALERAAARVVVFQPAIVPGLAQTPEYMRRVLELFGMGAEDVPGMVTARLQRQRILHEPGRDVTLLVTEGALRLRIGPPGVLLEQVDRLASLVDLPSVTVGVVPADVPAPSLPLSGYELLVDGEGSGTVFAEVLAGEVDTRGEDVTARYVADVAAWVKVAAMGEAARAELARIRAGVA